MIARFAAIRVRIADGAAPADKLCRGPAHARRGSLAGGRASLEWRTQILPLEPACRHPDQSAADAIKDRWICGQAHQRLKEELGLDHFEGRSWIGLHHHALKTTIGYAFLQYRQIALAGRKKESSARRRNRACQLCVKQYLTTCQALHRLNALAADVC